MKFTNPLYKRKINDNAPLGQPDPYIIKSGEYFYIYATASNGIQLYKSNDFDNWEYLGICHREEDKKEYWAPSVLELNGKFYLYYSCVNEGSLDPHEQAIRVAVSDNAQGPFKFIKTLLDPFSIDAHVVNTESGLYMFYCNNDYKSKRAGTYILVDKMLNPTTMENKPVAVILPTIDEEIFEKNRFKQGQHWHTIEGPFYFREGNWHYLTYSGSAFTNENYFIGYASAYCQDNIDLRQLKFIKQPSENEYNPLKRKDEYIEGTGHNSIIKIKDDYYIIYHGRLRSFDSSCDSRQMFAELLKADNGKLTIKPKNR